MEGKPAPPGARILLAVTGALRSPSRTAILTAVARALYREQPPPLVFDDFLASGLAGEEGSPLRERLLTAIPQPLVLGFTRWVCIRSRFAEEVVDRAAALGADQYVILGAGLDSFAYRRADLMADLRVFEVDHPGSQAWKRQRLEELGVGIPDKLTFAPVDFEHQSLREGLEEAGFDFSRAAVFAWVGVTMYLTREAIDTTLGTIARCQPGSRLVLTYNQPDEVLDPFSIAVTRAFRAIATEMGEPFLSLFTRKEIHHLLSSHGLEVTEDFGPDEARAAYFGGRSGIEVAGAQRVVAATVA